MKNANIFSPNGGRSGIGYAVAALALSGLTGTPTMAQSDPHFCRQHCQLEAGNVIVSRSVYDNKLSNVKVGQVLPPGCANTSAGCPSGGNAVSDGSFPYVFNNDLVDPSFGITSRLYLDQLTPAGHWISTLELPNSLMPGVGPESDQLVTSFSSKSEGALNLSTDGKYVTLIDYDATLRPEVRADDRFEPVLERPPDGQQPTRGNRPDGEHDHGRRHAHR